MSVSRVVMLLLALVLAVWGRDADAQQGCRRTRANLLGASRAPVVVSDSLKTVAQANQSRCSLAFINVSANDVYCADTSIDPVPTASTGLLIKGNGNGIALGTEGQSVWQCIRAGGADGVLNVIEGLP